MTLHQIRHPREEDPERQALAEGLAHLEGLPAAEALRQLRSTLEELGPLAAAAGAYLGSRPDLLNPEAVGALLFCRGRWRPEDQQDARQSLHRALEGSSTLLVDLSSLQPSAGGLRAQFQARTPAGQRLRLEIVPEALRQQALAQAEHLDLLASSLVRHGWAASATGQPEAPVAQRKDQLEGLLGALADFRQLLAAQFDLEAAAVQAADDGLSPVAELCSLSLLAYGEPRGTPLGEIPPRVSHAAGQGRELARALALAWLRPVFRGQPFRNTLDLGALLLLEGPEVRILGGLTTRPPEAFAVALRTYLKAVADDDTDAAWLALAPWFEGRPAHTGEPLRLRVRQAVAFRDARFSGHEDLSELLLVHWRLVTAAGPKPRPPLLAFFRGLAQITALARRLDPQGDAFLAAIEGLKTEESLEALQQQLSGKALGRSLEHQADLWLHLPQQMDQVLERLDGDQGVFRLRARDAPEEARRKDRRALRGATGLAFFAATALAQRFLPPAGWAQGLAALLVLAVGGLLLKEIYRAD